jgi:MFS family permease
MLAPRNIWALGWVSFFTDLATAITKPLIPIYVVLILNEGVDKLGYILAITTFVSYLFRWFGGWLSDKLQVTKPLLIVGYGLSMIMKPLMAFAVSWQSIAFYSATERLGKAIRSAPKDVLISASAQSSHQGRAFGVHKTLDIAGETLGGVVVFVLLILLGQSAEPIQMIFMSTLLPGAIAVLILIVFVQDKVKSEYMKPRPAASNDDIPQKQFDQGLWGWFFIYFFAVFFMLNDAFMLLQGHDKGVATFWLPLLMVTSGLTQTLISYAVGKKLDASGARTLMLVSLLSGIVSTALLFSEHPTGIFVAFVFQGIFMVTGLNALRTRIGQTKHAKGKAYGVFYLGTAIATALGNLIIGQLWEHLGNHQALIFSLTGLVILLVVSVLKPKLLVENGADSKFIHPAT